MKHRRLTGWIMLALLQAAKKAALKGTSSTKLSKVRTSVTFHRLVLSHSERREHFAGSADADAFPRTTAPRPCPSPVRPSTRESRSSMSPAWMPTARLSTLSTPSRR